MVEEDTRTTEPDSTRRPRRSPAVRFMLARLVQGLVVLVGAVIVSFALTHITGDPAKVLAGGQMTEQQVEQLSAQLGYDRPVLVQFADYIGGVFRGDLGTSFRYGEPAMTTVLNALPYTLGLVVGAVVLASMLALPIAVLSVLRREKLIDRVIRRSLMVGQGIPEYWLGLMLVLVFAVALGWVPSVYDSSTVAWILPLVTLAVPLLAQLVRMLRAEMLDVMTLDFIMALRGRGMIDRHIVLGHTVRNAVVPFLSFLGLQAGWLMGGTIIVESVFVWPGIGTLLIQAVETRDLAVIQAIVVVIAASYVLISTVVDALSMMIDPRIRIGGARS